LTVVGVAVDVLVGVAVGGTGVLVVWAAARGSVNELRIKEKQRTIANRELSLPAILLITSL
jgi:hypothetical protein